MPDRVRACRPPVPGGTPATFRARVLITADSVGGVFPHAVDLAHGLALLGIATVFVVLGPAMSAAQRRAVDAVPGARGIETGLALDWLAPNRGALAEAADAVAAIAREARVDLVHLTSPSLALADHRTRIVVGVHSCISSWWEAVRGGECPDDFSWRGAILGEGVRAADLVVAPSRSYADAVARLHGRTPRIVLNGRAPPPGHPEPAAAPAPFAVTIGRLWDEAKDFSTLDAAGGRMRTPLRAIGPAAGPNGASVRPRHAQACGRQDEDVVRQTLRARPVFVSASLYEPFGLSALEAAQAGCALVLSDIAVHRELWDGAAVFVPARDPGGFARAIDALGDDPERRAQLGAAARARAARYTVDAMADGMHALYAELGVAA